MDRHIVGTNSIRFKLLSNISGSSDSENSGDHSYYLYYGNGSATSPPEVTGNVYLNKNVDMELGTGRPDYWYKTSSYTGTDPFKLTTTYNETYSLGRTGMNSHYDLGISTIVPLTNGDKVHTSVYMNISRTSGTGTVYFRDVNGGTEADGTATPSFNNWDSDSNTSGWELFETTYTATGDYDYRLWIYPSNFRGTVYADLAIIRKYTDNEPTVGAGSETDILTTPGTWTSPTDSNVIDLTWNGGWGDGTDGSTAFSATVASVSADATITFKMKVATTAGGLSSESWSSIIGN